MPKICLTATGECWRCVLTAHWHIHSTIPLSNEEKESTIQNVKKLLEFYIFKDIVRDAPTPGPFIKVRWVSFDIFHAAQSEWCLRCRAAQLSTWYYKRTNVLRQVLQLSAVAERDLTDACRGTKWSAQLTLTESISMTLWKPFVNTAPGRTSALGNSFRCCKTRFSRLWPMRTRASRSRLAFWAQFFSPFHFLAHTTVRFGMLSSDDHMMTWLTHHRVDKLRTRLRLGSRQQNVLQQHLEFERARVQERSRDHHHWRCPRI